MENIKIIDEFQISLNCEKNTSLCRHCLKLHRKDSMKTLFQHTHLIIFSTQMVYTNSYSVFKQNSEDQFETMFKSRGIFTTELAVIQTAVNFSLTQQRNTFICTDNICVSKEIQNNRKVELQIFVYTIIYSRVEY